jgi:predicted DsbA family dithiol-disulfide isomerase
MSASATLVVDMISDVVCPWCYVGKRFLERGIAAKPEIAVEVRFRPYFLNPWVPREGISREEYLITKFGSVERYNSGNNRVAEAAAAAALTYHRDLIKRQPNTLDCHRLIRWAAQEGSAAVMKQRLMELYFSEGGDLTQSEVLVAAAADCGLSADAVRKRLASDEDADAVTREAQSANEAGIQGVPFFIFGGLLALSGAQPAESIAEAIERATAELAKRVAAE